MGNKITFTNDFHNTEINLIVVDGKITESQMKRSKRVLCGSDCSCSDEMGARGNQDHGMVCEPVFDSRVGRVIGFTVED